MTDIPKRALVALVNRKTDLVKRRGRKATTSGQCPGKKAEGKGHSRHDRIRKQPRSSPLHDRHDSSPSLLASLSRFGFTQPRLTQSANLVTFPLVDCLGALNDPPCGVEHDRVPWRRRQRPLTYSQRSGPTVVPSGVGVHIDVNAYDHGRAGGDQICPIGAVSLADVQVFNFELTPGLDTPDWPSLTSTQMLQQI